MKTTAKPTPGEYLRTGGTFVYVLNDEGTNRIFCNVQQGFESEMLCKRVSAEEAAATASLFAEAGTVHHETGLTPRQLLDQRNVLWDALENIKSYPIARPHPDGPSIARDHMAEIQAAIAKVMNEGRSAEPEPRFENVGCSQCGQTFGPGDHGFSHCENHAGMKGER